ncbi:1,5-anhydro-D-fructose reductase-like [Contarinia nasturtii]|uniref:1,5-anhydro-D-fructose reductase-like n=1 Tax=Contarinia nasturtii TaxID=265458 RepID=UPI0012D4B2EC|nr:1,5-anhydro-D-fructose reductase-like [Contarinia nasturtii]
MAANILTIPTTTLNNGVQMPAFGLGTFNIKGGEGVDVIKDAIDIGYRHFDTAFLYNNESELGEAINDKIANKVIKREDVFVVTKLWNTYHEPERVREGCDKSLTNLGLDYIDLYLMHFPVSFEYHGDDIPWPKSGPNNEPNAINDIDYLDTWKEMEKLVDSGIVKSIGVSNFNSEQVDRLCKEGRIKPVVNQVECSPIINQKRLNAFCTERDVLIIGYSPLGKKLISRPEIEEIAKKYDKTAAQIILRYLHELGVTPIPKTTHKKRLKENIDIFHFQLAQEDKEALDAMNTGERTVRLPNSIHAKHYPFNLEF